jgi:hypothetical protein
MKRRMILNCLLCCAVSAAVAQEIELRGVVKEAGSYEVMAFVNVVLQTTDSTFVTGTSSDDDGGFVLTGVTPGDYRLVVSYVGYVTQFIALEGLKANLVLDDVLLDDAAVALDGVTVTARTGRIDRKLVFPSEKQVQASTNGIELLQQLMLPRLQVNPLTNEAGLAGGGEVQLRINGVQVENSDVMALQPRDVIRVEYHDNPGLRYGNAAAVVDYIVRRPETGGNFGLYLWDDYNLKRSGTERFNGRINHKKSEFSFHYAFYHRDLHEIWRDNEETFLLADGSHLRRKEEGEPGRGLENSSVLKAAYSYLNGGRAFNATLRYFRNRQHHLDYEGRLYNRDNRDDYVQMFDGNSEFASRPALDLYYQEQLAEGQTLVLNLVGTFHATDNSRHYTESRDGVRLTEVENAVAGEKYSWIGEGIYEKRLGDSGNSLSAGLRHTQSYADNTYRSGKAAARVTEMRQGETFAYAEWKGTVRRLSYTLGAGATHASFRQEGDRAYDTWMFNPRLALHCLLPGHSSVRLTAHLSNSLPSLPELSAVEQLIDSFQVQRGNPGLTPYFRYENALTYDWQRGIVSVSLQGKHEYRPSAIMDEKRLEGNRIVQTWANQQSWQQTHASLNLRLGPVREIFTLTVFGGVNHYISRGNAYHHVYTNPFLLTTLTAGYRNFNLMFLWDALPSNRFYGETLSGGERIHGVYLDYRYRNMRFGFVKFNPFVNNFRQDSENRSQYASYRRSAYNNDILKSYMFRFSWDFEFGRTFHSAPKRLNNADEDSGVLKAGK